MNGISSSSKPFIKISHKFKKISDYFFSYYEMTHKWDVNIFQKLKFLNDTIQFLPYSLSEKYKYSKRNLLFQK